MGDTTGDPSDDDDDDDDDDVDDDNDHDVHDDLETEEAMQAAAVLQVRDPLLFFFAHLAISHILHIPHISSVSPVTNFKSTAFNRGRYFLLRCVYHSCC